MATWQPIHRETAARLLTYADRRAELAAELHAMHAAGLSTHLIDVLSDGSKQPLDTLDPFTFLAAFNRYIGDTGRSERWALLKARWGLAAPVPDEYLLPLANNFSWWFFPYASHRQPGDLDALWALAAAAVDSPPSAIPPEKFDRCLAIRTVGFAKLSMGLFWLNPEAHLSLDENTRELLDRNGVAVGKPSHASYAAAVEKARAVLGTDHVALCRRAYLEADAAEESGPDFSLTPAQWEMLWARFRARVPGFVSFAEPGALEGNELAYKRKTLARFQAELPREKLRTLALEGGAQEVPKKVSAIFGNLADFRSWDALFGKTEESAAAVLSALLDTTEQAYSGPRTLQPVFDELDSPNLRPAPDALSVMLWGLRPSDFFPVKISYYQELAKELDQPALAKGKFTARKLDEVIRWGRAFREGLESQGVRDWIDAQSFIWCVCPGFKGGTVIETAPVPGPKIIVPPPPAFAAAPLNAILYGAPGTGKTYRAIRHAVEVIDGAAGDDAPERFRELCREGRIGLVTFHQAFAYEDFVEGIRPRLDPEEEGAARYELHTGVFKEIAARALRDCLERTPERTRELGFEQRWAVFAAQIETEPEREYDGLTAASRYRFELTAKGNIRAVNAKSGRVYQASRSKVEAVFSAHPDGRPLDSGDVLNVVGVGCHSHVIAPVVNLLRTLKLVPASAPAYAEEAAATIVIRYLRDGGRSGWRMKPRAQWRPFVLVIDEINRGNISRIFGELITLLEDDKRWGAEHALGPTLPYSREPFAVPPNLHVLGTMNSTDKSIALLDAALRRRFVFDEIAPDFSAATCPHLPDAAREALRELNRRIALRKDRDHRIGHASFRDVRDAEGFDRVFRGSVVPLMQEYFFGDWAGLRFVLGESGKSWRFLVPAEGSDRLPPEEIRNEWQWWCDASGAPSAFSPLAALVENYAPAATA